jgi:hypothetical protein
MFGLIVLYVSSRAVMNDRGGARLTSEEPLQTVVDVVPGVIGLGGYSHRQDENHHRRQANARRIASFRAHHHSSSSVLRKTLNKTINIVSPKVDFLSKKASHRGHGGHRGVDFAGWSGRWVAICWSPLWPPETIQELRQSHSGSYQLLSGQCLVFILVVVRQGDRNP